MKENERKWKKIWENESKMKETERKWKKMMRAIFEREMHRV